jgi:UDP-N-acetylglucosamine--N-acetylmuramyl-(pentapeptide) pyrophosphoryl-undecaprenol N-acetylglucosamine transferase
MDKKTVASSVLCFVAGRSGGHIIPALTLARKEKSEHPDTHILLFTTATKLDFDIAAKSTDIDQHIPLALNNVPYKNPLLWPLFIYQMIKACISSFLTLRTTRPCKIISMGGYVSLPVCLAGKLLKIPIELMELNVEPGAAISWLTPLADTIGICFEDTKKYLNSPRIRLVDYPVRFSSQERSLDKYEARTLLHIPHHKKVILVLGGSQGSLFINKAIHAWLEQLSTTERSFLYMLHQVGNNQDLDALQACYKNWSIDGSLFSYHHDMAYLYAAADLVICRAGAGTLFETLFFQKPCITIPLETSSNTHQVANAQSLAKNYSHLVTVLRQSSVSKEFMHIIRKKLSDHSASTENSMH